MPLTRKAKILSKAQIDALLGYVATTRYPIRNRAIILLSVKAGLRAKEIAALQWSMVCDAQGTLVRQIRLTDTASKGRSGRVIPMNAELSVTLASLMKRTEGRTAFVIASERADQMSAQSIVNLFDRWYDAVGFAGCSSHSGRRTFITAIARKINIAGGSIRDVQELAGHSSLRTTQGYIEENLAAQTKVVSLI